METLRLCGVRRRLTEIQNSYGGGKVTTVLVGPIRSMHYYNHLHRYRTFCCFERDIQCTGVADIDRR